jgi:pimeloyl-ACP methyl ester carboxylesterase
MEGPTSHSYFSQRLRLHYVDWGNDDAPPMLLIHGGRDHCRNWDWVAEEFRLDYHIIAPDLRGHGDSQWMIGGSYNQVDYLYDIAQLLHQTKMTPVTIISHSLGGSIALMYAGIFPATVTKLVVIERLGPPPKMVKNHIEVPIEERLQFWIKDLRKASGRIPRRYKSLEDAYERMQTENPHLTETQARHLTIHGSNQNEDGTYTWKFDNYVRTFSPVGVSSEDQIKAYARISCPTLLVRGTESWASDPERDGRVQNFQDARVANIENAGHWVHHDQLEVFISLTKEFFAAA